MSEPTEKAKRPDYGIDAPGAVRNLAIGGAVVINLRAENLKVVTPQSGDPDFLKARVEASEGRKIASSDTKRERASRFPEAFSDVLNFQAEF